MGAIIKQFRISVYPILYLQNDIIKSDRKALSQASVMNSDKPATFTQENILS